MNGIQFLKRAIQFPNALYLLPSLLASSSLSINIMARVDKFHRDGWIRIRYGGGLCGEDGRYLELGNLEKLL